MTSGGLGRPAVRPEQFDPIELNHNLRNQTVVGFDDWA